MNLRMTMKCIYKVDITNEVAVDLTAATSIDCPSWCN